MMLPDLALIALLEQPVVTRRDEARIRVAHTFTALQETTLPGGIWPTSLREIATGSSCVTTEVEKLVRSADHYLRSLAVLPIDPDYEARVDAVLDARIQGTRSKRLLRRR